MSAGRNDIDILIARLKSCSDRSVAKSAGSGATGLGGGALALVVTGGAAAPIALPAMAVTAGYSAAKGSKAHKASTVLQRLEAVVETATQGQLDTAMFIVREGIADSKLKNRADKINNKHKSKKGAEPIKPEELVTKHKYGGIMAETLDAVVRAAQLGRVVNVDRLIAVVASKISDNISEPGLLAKVAKRKGHFELAKEGYKIAGPLDRAIGGDGTFVSRLDEVRRAREERIANENGGGQSAAAVAGKIALGSLKIAGAVAEVAGAVLG